MKNYLVYPTKRMYISQGYNGRYSHNKCSTGIPYDFPIDESCGDNGRDYFYCPCNSMVIKRIYGVFGKGTNTIWLESMEPVILANGNESYVTIMVIHPNDDTLKNIKIGQKFKRGDAMFQEGNDGYATGNHFHISVSASKYIPGGWVKNSKGGWVIKGNPIKPEEAFFIDREFTTIINRGGLNFKYLSKTIGKCVLRNEKINQVEVFVNKLHVRTKPFGSILGYANLGIYNVLDTKEDKYTWYNIDNSMWIAGNKMWVKYYPKKIDDIIIVDKNNTNNIIENKLNDKPIKISFWQKIVHLFLRIFKIFKK